MKARALIPVFAMYFVYLVLSPVLVSAHASGGSWEQAVDGYIVDIGYDTPTFTTDGSVAFDLSLKVSETGEQSPFSHAWVRLQDAEGTILATGIHRQKIGPTTLLFEFARPGAYTLEASFRDESGSEIVGASFPIEVEKGEGDRSVLLSYIVSAAGLLLLSGVVVLMLRLRKR